MGTDHQVRVTRLLRGDQNIMDLERLFLDLRELSPTKLAVKEVGDFAAHRKARDRGVVVARVADTQTSLRGWQTQIQGGIPSLEEARVLAEANLRIAPDERVFEALGMTKQQARSHYNRAEAKLMQGQKPNKSQSLAFNWLAGSGFWQTAFTDEDLIDQFTEAVIELGALADADRQQFYACKTFVALHAISLMHQTNVVLPDGGLAPLRIRVQESTGHLVVRADIPLNQASNSKPVYASVPVFQTTLPAQLFCEAVMDASGRLDGVHIEVQRLKLVEVV